MALLEFETKTEKPCCCCCYYSNESDLYSMIVPQNEDGDQCEIYASMIEHCFGIQMEIGSEYIYKDLYLLCKTCISYLRNAYRFRNQVENAYNRIKDLMNKNVFSPDKRDMKLESFIEEVKSEPEYLDDNIEMEDSNPLEKELPKNNLNINSGSDIDYFKKCSESQSNNGVRVLNKNKKQKIKRNKTKIVGIQRLSKPDFYVDKNDLTCKICNETFTWNRNLKSHMAVHFPNYVCHICSKPYTTKRNLHAHILYHEERDKLLHCNVCNETFKGKTNLHNHKRKNHGLGCYKCPHCLEKFINFSKKIAHLAEVHNEDRRKYKCKFCDKAFSINGHLISHINTAHLNTKKYACDKCDMTFYHKTRFDDHMLVHSGIKDFHCKICNKSYMRKRALVQHMKIHNDVKDFICHICTRAFTQKCSLKGHLKIHSKSNANDQSKGT